MGTEFQNNRFGYFRFLSLISSHRKPVKRLRCEKEKQRRKHTPLKSGLLAGGASAPQIRFAAQNKLRRGGFADPEHFKPKEWSDYRERSPKKKDTTKGDSS